MALAGKGLALLSRLRGRFSPPQAEIPPEPLFTAEYVQEYAHRFHQHQLQQNAPRKFTPFWIESKCFTKVAENSITVVKEVECPGRDGNAQ